MEAVCGKRHSDEKKDGGGKVKFSKKVEKLLASRAAYPLAKEYDVRARGAINLASNESPYGPSPKVIRALKKEVEKAGVYPDPRALELKRAIGKFIGVDPEYICIGNGSDELMDLLCRLFLNEGDRVAIPIPSFPFYELCSLTNGGRPSFISLNGFTWSRSIVREVEGARLVFIGRPNNPTGTAPDESLIEEMTENAEEVIVDEAYIEFAGRSIAKKASEMENLTVLRTFSKAFGLAGLRIGYAICNRRTAEASEKIRAPFNVNRMAQVAAVAALQDLDFLKKVVKRVRKNREFFREELERLGLGVIPSQANFLMVDVSQWGCCAPDICERLSRKKIYIRDLSDFRGAGKNYVRISVGKEDEIVKLISELEKLRKEVKG